MKPRAGTILSVDQNRQSRVDGSMSRPKIVIKNMNNKNYQIPLENDSDSQESDKAEDDFYYLEQQKAPNAHSRRASDHSAFKNLVSQSNNNSKFSLMNMFNKKNR